VIDYAVVELPGPSTQAAEQAHEAVSKHDAVRYAEPDYEITLDRGDRGGDAERPAVG
jgi:hypothetical protein